MNDKTIMACFRSCGCICSAMILLLSAGTAQAQVISFADDFNRPDDYQVYNGWGWRGYIGIRDNQASLLIPTDVGGIYREFTPYTSVAVKATLLEKRGDSGLLGSYDAALVLYSTGAFANGFGILVFGSGNGDSSVSLIDNYHVIETQMTSFQFGEAIKVAMVISPDGLVAGTICGEGQTFAFTFGPHPIESVGLRFAYWASPCNWFGDQFLPPRLDDVSLIALTPADLDQDGDVDGVDLDLFLPCRSGPALLHNGSPICGQADLDYDGDVDQTDFGLIQRCYSGVGIIADAHCAD